jgi:hypothetical protein
MAPARAPPRSPVKAVVGYLRAGEPIEEHHGQGGRRGTRASPAADREGGPRRDERAVRQDQVPTRGPPRGMVWSLRKRAWCPPGELGGRRRRHRRQQERDAGGTAARKADKTVPRDVPVTLRTSGEKQVAAERLEWPPPKAPGRWSGGEVARTDTCGWPEWIEARPSGGGGGIAALASGERGQDHDVDERQRRWRHSDGEAQQEDAARHPEVSASEPTNWKGHWLGETEAARGELLHTTQEGHWLGETEAAQGGLLQATQEGHWLGETEAAQGGLLHAAQKPGEKAGQPRPCGESYEAPGEQRPKGGEHTGSPRDGGSDRSGAQHQMGSATESLSDTTGCHLVPMYQVIGLLVSVALLILLLVGILRMALNIVIRAIAIARARSYGWGLMVAFWGLLLQGAVAPVHGRWPKSAPLARRPSKLCACKRRVPRHGGRAQRTWKGPRPLGRAPASRTGSGAGAASSSARRTPARSTWSPPSRASKPPWGSRQPVGTRRTRRTEGDQLLQERGC